MLKVMLNSRLNVLPRIFVNFLLFLSVSMSHGQVVINELTAKVLALSGKYATTYSNVMEEIHQTEKVLSSMIDELDGNEFDMKGLNEFKSLLKGE